MTSILYYLLQFILTIVYGTLAIFLVPLSVYRRYQIIRSWAQINLWLLKKLCGLDYQIRGLENLPKSQGYIIVINHQSAWETLILQKIFDWIVFILKRELLWIPFFGFGMAVCWPIALNRKERKQALRHLNKQGRLRLEAGADIVIYPEGTRQPVDKMGKFNVGAAHLAMKTQTPIIPIAHNAGLFWPKNSIFKKSGCIEVVIGAPIYPEELSVRALNENVENWIKDTLQTLPPKRI